MTLPDTIHLSFTSSRSAVRRALEKLMQHLQNHAVGEEERGRIQLVLAEALNNIVEHGYPGAQSGPIELQCTLTEAGLDLVLSDCGARIPRRVLLPNPAPPPSARSDNPPEGGWGWFLIRELSANHAYRRDGDRNELRLHIPYSGGHIES
ncbi:ATP-binding protein [Thalassovita aquimarina]|uniref:ATP-binding protein n=1 Tax=Thalassovita aquimarina TaxID=2785917 RepID=A0ABS5HMQ3_9RHOB|nr:ATP-binding protein [Thalassovita aquimarina]MBR9650215.1 ATP-binding protein [Thalassovita aquimarina]